jgi:hypothetical protein
MIVARAKNYRGRETKDDVSATDEDHITPITDMKRT